MTAATITPPATAEPTKRDSDRETFLAAVARLVKDPANVMEWLMLRRRFKYSASNSMLIVAQYPELMTTGTVACRTDWERYGRSVNADAVPIFIWSKPFLAESRKYTNKDGSAKKVRVFKMQPVYAEQDTTVVNEKRWENNKAKLYQKQQRTVLCEKHEPVTGKSHKDAIPALVKLAEDNGLAVTFEKLTGALADSGGFHDAAGKRIVVNTAKGNPFGNSPNAQVRILVHELVHALGGTSYTKYGRETAEVLTDLTTWMVLTTVGIDAPESDCKVYIAGWLASARGDIDDTVKRIKTQAKALDVTAYTIEQAIISVLDPDALRKVAALDESE